MDALNSSPEDMGAVLVERTLRSGQSVSYAGHVVVLGDVHPGAEIVAGGNILVLGTLQGTVHAGVGGNEAAVVVAFRLRPSQLRIAHHITRPPDGQEFVPEEPEIARVKNGMVIIEKFGQHREG